MTLHKVTRIMTSAYMARKDGKMSLHVLTSTIELGTKKIQSNLIKFEKLAIPYYNGQSLDGRSNTFKQLRSTRTPRF